MSGGGGRELTFQELSQLRSQTELVSKLFRDQLAAHLETLRPVLVPERVFGKYVGGRGDATVADRAFAQLQQAYKSFTTRPFELPAEFDPHWLTLVGNRVTLYPWEYIHEARTERETQTIIMTSPVRWVVSYTSAYTLSQLKQAVTGKGERRPEHVRQFVVNALVTQLMMAHTPGLGALIADLRYHLQTDSAPDLPGLPLTLITSVLPSLRPADDLILAATSFSGVPAFVEVIDIDALANLRDPLKTRIAELIR